MTSTATQSDVTGMPVKVTTYGCGCIHASSLLASVAAASRCPSHGEPLVKDEQGRRFTVSAFRAAAVLGYMTGDEAAAAMG